MRESGLIDSLKRYNRNITDLGDLEVQTFTEPQGRIRSQKGVGHNNERLAEMVKEAMHTYHTVVNLGGDHSMAMGTVTGHTQSLFDGKKPAVIWVDAHADINTPLTSQSGNLHGQPVSFLMEEFPSSEFMQMSSFDWMSPSISGNDIAYIGLRDLDTPELEFLKKYDLLCKA